MYGPPLTSEEEAVFYQTRQPALYACVGVFLVIVNVAIPARLYINHRLHWRERGLLKEDAFAILSLLFVDAIFANLIVATWYGLGLHTWTVNALDSSWPRNISNSFRVSIAERFVVEHDRSADASQHIWITMVLMSAYLCSVKLTLLFFYKRLFLVSGNWLRIAWWVNLVYIVLWFFGATFFYLFQCHPVEWYWMQYYVKYDQPVPGGMTGDCKATDVRHVAMPLIFSLISDFAILALPIYAISKLHASPQRKTALFFVFGIGMMACLLELARILELIYDTNDKTDATWGVAVFLILTAAEETAVIVCATFPVIGPRLYGMWKKSHTMPYSFTENVDETPAPPSPHKATKKSRRSRATDTLNFLHFGAHHDIRTADLTMPSQAHLSHSNGSTSDVSSRTHVGRGSGEGAGNDDNDDDDERYKEEERIGCDFDKPSEATAYHEEVVEGQQAGSNHSSIHQHHGLHLPNHLPFRISPRHSTLEMRDETAAAEHLGEIRVQTEIDVQVRDDPRPNRERGSEHYFRFPSTLPRSTESSSN